jgi:hypothetical protein
MMLKILPASYVFTVNITYKMAPSSTTEVYLSTIRQSTAGSALTCNIPDSLWLIVS